MYKFLLVTDQANILETCEQIGNWSSMGFKAPHIRQTADEAIECLENHHADGIALAVDDAEDEKICHFLREKYPLLPIIPASANVAEMRKYLGELESLLNRIHADHTNGDFTEKDMMMICRHDFFRRVMNGKMENPKDILRHLRMVRSRMDPESPCVVVEMAQPAEDGSWRGHWHYSTDVLEARLRNCFGAELDGMRILPTILADDRIVMLCCPMLDCAAPASGESITSLMARHTEECMAHTREYLDLDLHVTGIRVLPSLTALCKGL